MSESSSGQRLDPTRLDPESLDPATYHRVVGPSLKVAADTAAKRGHPTLHDDMPAMLALIETIAHLSSLYAEHYPDAESNPTLLENAATGACVMVFQQARLPADSIGQCLAALETAHGQLHEHDVLVDARPYIAMAWSHFESDQREAALRCLGQACEHAIAAIEAWQTQVH